MPTEIMPRPDLREDWNPEPVRHRHRAARRRLAWIRDELAARPRLLAAILAAGVLAFLGGGMLAPPARVAAPKHTAPPTPFRSQQATPPVITTGAPATGTDTPTQRPATVAPARTTSHAPVPYATPEPTMPSPRPTVRPTHRSTPKPVRTRTSAPPEQHTATPKPPLSVPGD